MRRVEFVLTMPNVASWNGRWSGEGKHHAIVRQLREGDLARLHIAEGMTPSWYYNFGDGWGANVEARLVPAGARLKKSAGFCGYDWMVDNIIRWGTASCQCEWIPAPNFQADEDWERCRFCATHRKIAEGGKP